MNLHKRLAIAVTAISLLSSLLLGALSLTQFGYRVETLAYDTWFSLRYSVFGARPIDSRLILVGIDEPTIQHIGKPALLWQADLAELVAKIKEGEPAVVALDIISSPSLKGLAQSDPLRQRLSEEAFQLGMTALEPPSVLFIEVFADGFINDDAEQTDPVVPPHEVIVDLLTDQDGNTPSLTIANIAGDTDGVSRRGKLFTRFVRPERREQPINLAFRMLEEATGKPVEFHRKADGTPVLSWNGVKVPFLLQESFLLNYPGPTEDNTRDGHDPEKSLTFPLISGKQVFEGKVKPEYFKDKIVIVAPTASSLFDEKVVPGDFNYHGAATHLATLNMFLKNQFIHLSFGAWVVLITLSGLLGSFLGRQGRIVASLLGFIGLPLLSFFSLSFVNIWLPCIFPAIAFVGSGLLGYLVRLFTIERDRTRVRSTFARMVSPQVMNHVLTNYGSLKNGERKELTVLFSDINDFTPICEKYPPEEVIHMLSEYFSLMVDVIMKYDGYLKQYVGDEIMVIFGAPEDSEDHATRAVLTALEMRDVLARAKETSAGKPGFYEIKVGINTGSVVVGKVGPETRWEYAAVGDDVNLGARVMSAAQKMGMDIGVSAATKERFDKEMEQSSKFSDKVNWISKGVQSFKGKISQMEVFAIERDE